MEEVSDKQKYSYLFSSYTHNIPVIFSSLEGQYNGKLYLDDPLKPQIAVLFTPFAFHFIAGNMAIPDAAEILDKLIFQEYLPRNGQREAILFAPDTKGETILDDVLRRHQGIKDKRKVFCLNKDKFNRMQAESKDPADYPARVFYEQENGATKPYPVCRILKEDECISYCSGFMLGKGHAEIDIFTVEEFRNQGYAKQAAIGLIRELLAAGLEPDWNTWPYRFASEKLALSLGFMIKSEISAFIWSEDECGKL